uniref:THO complex subunit 7 homolog n=1 Tax=Coccolithus braarudii TaxID=221442 RepID=A0A7S0L844_9EUKA|mmetsp:Transcript_20535/g.44070  ORF Transcript_20535/g.44070 Transcript_20535/m.44070 type:complete len:188 (+) Transcript_20535:50-613(+)
MTGGDDEIFKMRLLAKDQSLKSLSKRFLIFSAAIEKDSVSRCEQLHAEMLKELAAYEFGMTKARSLIDTNTQQVKEYDRMNYDIEEEMKTTRADIEHLTSQLQHERVLRSQREQYAALAKRINAYPPREQTQSDLLALQAEVSALEAEDADVLATLERRAKLFAGLMHNLHELEAHLAEDGGPMLTS